MLVRNKCATADLSLSAIALASLPSSHAYPSCHPSMDQPVSS